MKVNTCEQLGLLIYLIISINQIKSETANRISSDGIYYNTDGSIFNIGQLENDPDYTDQDNTLRSLVFVFDSTFSMSPELKDVIDGATLIFNTISDSTSLIENYIFVPFNDPTIGPVLDTTDDALFIKTLKELKVYSNMNYDCPEMSLGGIKAALEACLPYSYVYVFTDASAKDYQLIEPVLELIQRKKTQVVFILSGDCGAGYQNTINYQVYEKIKSVSSGQIFNVEKKEFSQVLKYVNDNFDGNVVNIFTKQYPKSDGHNETIAVDNTLDKVTVSVSGDNSKLTIADPKGENITDPAKIVKIVDLSKIKIFNIVDPEPGNWTVIISSDSEHSLKITGVSEIEFDLGYFLNTSNSFTETSQRPLKGVPNRLLVRVRNDAGQVSQLENVELSNVDGKVLIELTLTKDENVIHIYKSEPFLPPDEYFHTTVIGKDKDGNRIKRSGSTAVTAQNPEQPFITVKTEINAYRYKSVTLNCKFDSLIPVSASWFIGDKPLQKEQKFVFSNQIEFVIKNATESATYTCKAENSVGSSKKDTLVKISDKPPIVIDNTTPITNVRFYLDDSGNGLYTFKLGTKEMTALMAANYGQARSNKNTTMPTITNGTL